jgi:hypothetical protein
MQNHNSDEPLKFSDRPLPPSLTSYEAGWHSVSLEQHYQPPAEIPICLDCYTISIHIRQNSVHHLGGLSPTQLRLVVNYINDRLEQELSSNPHSALQFLAHEDSTIEPYC